jgi:hypothetical protein
MRPSARSEALRRRRPSLPHKTWDASAEPFDLAIRLLGIENRSVSIATSTGQQPRTRPSRPSGGEFITALDEAESLLQTPAQNKSGGCMHRPVGGK